jgi:hypothetical protein
MTPNITGTRRASVDHDCCCTLFGVASTVARYSDRVDKMVVESNIVTKVAIVEMAVKGEYNDFKIASSVCDTCLCFHQVARAGFNWITD